MTQVPVIKPFNAKEWKAKMLEEYRKRNPDAPVIEEEKV